MHQIRKMTKCEKVINTVLVTKRWEFLDLKPFGYSGGEFPSTPNNKEELKLARPILRRSLMRRTKD